MALHEVSTGRIDEAADVYSTELSREPLPRHAIPDGESDPVAAYYLIREDLALEGNSSQNLATFCTTWSDDETHRLMDDNLDKNLIDKDEYPQTTEIESRCVHILADLWHVPTESGAIGCSTTGSSEACMLAGMALKTRWRQAREAAGKSTNRPNLVAGPVQVCWEKFARYFDVELRQIPLEPDATGLRPHQLRDYVDENTIGVVAILGVTYTCAFEPVEAIAAELDVIASDTGLDVPLHVDAASGGFVAPFTQPDLRWDFRLPRVASINASGHKYGLAPLGVGWVVWRDKSLLPDELVFTVDYLGGQMPTFALNFSRPGGEVIAQYYAFVRLGREGFTKVQQACAETAQYLARRISEIDALDVLYDGDGGLPAVSYRLNPDMSGWTLYDLSDRLRTRGWQVPSYPLPANRGDVIQRVLIRHGTGRDKIIRLIADIRDAVDELTRHGGTEIPAHSGFHH
ncbi:glutamate decarboxylase [Stackebrandtia soli]|uniref:glutamate decarboxylase n=1 Tax=Stackebrandtia soli TaxID=1892856 RepID=UPI0039EC7BA8